MTKTENADIAVRGGVVVSGRGTHTRDVFIKDGLINSVEERGGEKTASRTIDASGKYVLPGIIDAHLHPVYADRIDTLSKAAAQAGITTLIPYVGAVKAWGKSGTPFDAVRDFIEEGESTSLVDFGVHCTLLHDDIQECERIVPQLIKLGVISFKVFMAYKKRGMQLEDEELIAVMKAVSENHALLAAHAENGTILDHLETLSMSRGNETPDCYPPSHPGISEAEAVFRLLTLGRITNCPIYIPHISAWETLEVIALFKAWGGPPFFVETCPHYLTLTDEEMVKRGSIAKMAPPLRTRKDIDRLWGAVCDGMVDVIASDTAGHTVQSNEPLRDKIFDAPNGIPGVDTLFSIPYDEGVNGGRLELPRLVELTCENPARIFGLFPGKGILQAGSDADLVLFDPNATHRIEPKNPHLNVDYSMYEGRNCLGQPELVMQRGEILMERGELKGSPGRGKYIPGELGSKHDS